MQGHMFASIHRRRAEQDPDILIARLVNDKILVAASQFSPFMPMSAAEAVFEPTQLS